MQAPRTQTLPAWEEAYILLALAFVTGSLEPILISFGGVGASLTESSPANLYSALAVYSVAIGLMLLQPAEAWRTIRREPLLLLLFALPLVSTFWSDDGSVTFRRATANAMTGAFCVYLALRLTPKDLLRALLVVLFLGGIASFAITVLAPSLAIGHGIVNQGSWSGIYGHKALLGRVCAIAFFVALCVEPRNVYEMIMRWTTLTMFVVLAYFSQSRASWAMMALGLCVAFVLLFWRSRRLSASLKIVVSASVALIIIVGVLVSADAILQAIGRNETLSGRTKLWSGAIAVAEERHPILGAGYRNFWTEDSAAGVRSYIANWAELPGHGHNGYLDIWLELGIPGALLFLAFLAQGGVRLAARVWSGSDGRMWLGLSLLFFTFMLNNFTASVAMKHSDILWVLAVLISIYAHGAPHSRLFPAFAWTRPLRLAPLPVAHARGPRLIRRKLVINNGAAQ
jgi:exopolysaccharide production protein ExoQ